MSIFDLQLHKKNRFSRKLVLRKNSRFSVTFLGFFPDAFENYWKFFTFDTPKYQLDSLSYQKQGPLFKIEALLLLQNVVTDTHTKKTHIIVKSIYSSLRSESKITFVLTVLNLLKWEGKCLLPLDRPSSDPPIYVRSQTAPIHCLVISKQPPSKRSNKQSSLGMPNYLHQQKKPEPFGNLTVRKTFFDGSRLEIDLFRVRVPNKQKMCGLIIKKNTPIIKCNQFVIIQNIFVQMQQH
ncbi:Uncharacterized protein FWK35_00015292 [Aphis craccivora]|uniref:Uncharacterized protein n=1 Tax=Aphis craccivora TaxID=307492 RepID=A0A6G0YGM1_APHCR|nr:Uncharacterized protein FWK35_00015292 [Aphis craccivora]